MAAVLTGRRGMARRSGWTYPDRDLAPVPFPEGNGAGPFASSRGGHLKHPPALNSYRTWPAIQGAALMRSGRSGPAWFASTDRQAWSSTWANTAGAVMHIA